MNRFRVNLLIALAIFLNFTLPARNCIAEIRHVPLGYPTIQAAVDACADGDTVMIAPGTYSGAENYGIECGSLDISLIGSAGSELTTIDCQELGRGIRGTGALYIRGLSIVNGSADIGGGLAVGGYAELLDLSIRDCQVSGGGGGIHINGSNVKVRFCEIIDCSTETTGGAIYFHYSCQNINLQDLLVRGNSGSTAGIRISENCSVSIEKVTLVENEGRALFVSDESSMDVDDCIVAFNLGDHPAVDGSAFMVTFDFDCSNFFANEGGNFSANIGDQVGQEGNISADPMFCGSIIGDFTLFSTSPCLPANNSCGVQMGAFGQGCGGGNLYEISGRIRDEDGNDLAGVLVDGFQDIYTAADGTYSMLVPEGWSGNLTPCGWFHFNSFDPDMRSYINIQGDAPDQDYTAIGRRICYIPDDYAEVQEAMSIALSGDTIEVAPGSYLLTGTSGFRYGYRDINLRSSDGPELTTLDLSGLDVPIGTLYGILFDQYESPNAILDGFTLTGIGFNYEIDQSVIYCTNGSTPTLRNLIIRDNTYSNRGVGIRIVNASPSVSNSSFLNNSAFRGGAIYCDGGTLSLQNVYFEGNRAWLGASLFIQENADVTCSGASFIDNTANSTVGDGWSAGGSGGGIYVDESNLDLDNCVFTRNIARRETSWYRSGSGGAISLVHSNASISACTFSGNTAEHYGEPRGGNIYIGDANAYLENSIVAFALEGGGIYVSDEASVLDMICNDVYGNGDGDYLGLAEDHTGIDGNISDDPRFCDAEALDLSLEVSSPCLPDNNDCGVQMGAYGEGCDLTDSGDENPPIAFGLEQNHPNPFNPSTEITFSLAARGPVSLRIFDLQGRLVRTLLNETVLGAGRHARVWTGRDERERIVSSGVYLYRLESEAQSEIRKMLLLK